MYEEKNKLKKNIFKFQSRKEHPILDKIKWRHLGLKLLITILVILLIIFTISRINKEHHKQEEKLTNNINIIVEEAIKYYTTNNTFPKNIGDSSSLLLNEMKELKLINEIKDSNGKSCNFLDSYILLTKSTKDEYRLKVYLKCSKQEKTEEKILNCPNNICQ